MTVSQSAESWRCRRLPIALSPGQSAAAADLLMTTCAEMRQVIVRLERPAGDEVDAHRLEVVAGREGHAAATGRRRLRPPCLRAGTASRAVPSFSGMFSTRPTSCTPGSARSRSMNCEIEAREGRPVRQVRIFRRDLKREDVLRVVAGIDVAQRPEAAHEQSGPDQQHERERGLTGDQSVASPVAPARRAAAAVAETRELGRRTRGAPARRRTPAPRRSRRRA